MKRCILFKRSAQALDPFSTGISGIGKEQKENNIPHIKQQISPIEANEVETKHEIDDNHSIKEYQRRHKDTTETEHIKVSDENITPILSVPEFDPEEDKPKREDKHMNQANKEIDGYQNIEALHDASPSNPSTQRLGETKNRDIPIMIESEFDPDLDKPRRGKVFINYNVEKESLPDCRQSTSETECTSNEMPLILETNFDPDSDKPKNGVAYLSMNEDVEGQVFMEKEVKSVTPLVQEFNPLKDNPVLETKYKSINSKDACQREVETPESIQSTQHDQSKANSPRSPQNGSIRIKLSPTGSKKNCILDSERSIPLLSKPRSSAQSGQ